MRPYRSLCLSLLASALLASVTPTLLAQAAATKRSTAKKPAKKAAPAASANDNRWAIHEIKVEGLHVYTPDAVLAVAGLKKGSRVNKEELEKARDTMLASGAFDSIAYRYQPSSEGIALQFEIRESEHRGKWRIDALPLETRAFAMRAASADPLFGAEIPLNDVYTKRLATLAETMLQEESKPDTVIVKYEPGADGKLVAVLRSKTPPPNIAEVYFKGVQAITEPELQKDIAAVAIGTPWDERLFRSFLEQTIRTSYDAKGRLRAKFPTFAVTPSKSAKGVAVTVNVEEGPEFKLQKLVFRDSVLTQEELDKLGGDFFKTDVVANISRVGMGLLKVLERMRELGFLKATYGATKEIDDATQKVTLVINFRPGAQYKMGRLDIVGLDIIAEPEVRKLWVVDPGKPYRDGYPDLFLREIRRRGVLDFLGETKAETKIDDQRLTVDVKLVFKGGQQKLDSRPRDRHGELIEQPQQQ